LRRRTNEEGGATADSFQLNKLNKERNMPKYDITVTRYAEVAQMAQNSIEVEAESVDAAKDQVFEIMLSKRDEIDWSWGKPEEYGHESFAFDISDDSGAEYRFEVDEKGYTESRRGPEDNVATTKFGDQGG
jgi:hypothetical protein